MRNQDQPQRGIDEAILARAAEKRDIRTIDARLDEQAVALAEILRVVNEAHDDRVETRRRIDHNDMQIARLLEAQGLSADGTIEGDRRTRAERMTRDAAEVRPARPEVFVALTWRQSLIVAVMTAVILLLSARVIDLADVGSISAILRAFGL